MANELRQTNGSDTQLTLPARRSDAYRAWLIVKIGELAAYLRQGQQLDSAGFLQAEMANDLADTSPVVMHATFARLRRECTFLPVTKEILDTYREEAERHVAASRQAEREQKDAEEREARRANPEDFTTLGRTIMDSPELASLAAPIRERLKKAKRQADYAAQPRPDQTDACPHCGGKLVTRVSNLRYLYTPADLRALADRWESEASARATAAQQVQKEQVNG